MKYKNFNSQDALCGLNNDYNRYIDSETELKSKNLVKESSLFYYNKVTQISRKVENFINEKLKKESLNDIISKYFYN